MSDAKWYLYMIVSTDDHLFIGVTSDIEHRFREHGSGWF
ncbi:MAG: putative GIY-YIG superfamily endonuclease [Shewanella sp.]|jgi:predicted GIY-YIG superfamily endonuclease